jgi:anthranilate phosphoribosyltransferase
MKTDWLRHAPLAELPHGGTANTLLRPYIWRLMRGEDLTQAEAAEFTRLMLDQNRTNVEQIAAALVALAIKGETGAELAGMASVIRERAVKFETSKQVFADIGGTGGSAKQLFNISTAAAFVAAGAGLFIAKQSSRRVAGASGSVEALEALKLRLNFKKDNGGAAKSQEIAVNTFEGIGLGFLSSTAFHAAMTRVANVRSKLGFRTTFNIIRALSNPAAPPFQVVGVWHRSLLEPTAEALALLGAKRAWVVHGADGLDELSLAGETFVAEVTNGKVKTFTVEPEDFGIKRGTIEHLQVSTPAASARIIQEVLSGTRRDQARAIVVLNAAAAMLVSGVANSKMYAARLAEQSLDSGAARQKLERLIMFTDKNTAERVGAANSQVQK